MEDEILTVKDVASYLKLSELSLYRLLRDRKIPAFKIGQQWRFRRSALDEWIDKRSIEEAPAEKP
ncbi:MAG: helix-turn-helix domain-containing protein [Candidatus Methanosuratincola sp.]|jgi:excisionase family DNA binding protein